MKQDNCPFTRTKRNDLMRFNPSSPRVAVCFALYDDLRVLHQLSDMSDETWNKGVNQLKSTLDHAKKAKAKFEPKPEVKPITS